MHGAPLPGVLAHLAPVLDRFGYLAVGGLILLEDFGVPSPGETVLIAAAVYAGAGKLNIVLVGVVGFVAAVVGDNIGYAIGVYGGRPLVHRYGRYVLLTKERFEKTEQFFERHGGKVVTIARFVEGLRQANGIVAGISTMRWRSFLLFNALGAALWVGVWTSIGFLAGSHIDAVYAEAQRYSLVLTGVVAGLIVALIVRALVRRRRKRG